MYQSADNSSPTATPVAAPHCAWGFAVLVGLAAVVLTAGLVTRFAPRADRPIALVLLAGLFIVGDLLRVQMPHGADQVMLTMGGASLVVGMVLGRPVDVVIAASVAALVVAVVDRAWPFEVVFHVARTGWSTSVGVLLFFAMHPDRRQNAPTLWAAIIACGEAAVVLAMTTAVMSRLRTHAIAIRATLRRLVVTVVATTTSAAIGVQAISLGRRSPWLLPLVIVPVALVLMAFRTYAAERRSWLRHEFIHQATAALHQDRNLDDGMEAVLGQIRGALQAQFAQVVLFSANGTLGVLAHDDATKSRSLGEPSTEEIEAAWRLAEHLPGPAIVGVSPASRELLGVLGVRQGIAVPLRHDGRVAGLLLVANRSGDAPSFRRDERAIVTLVAQQIEVAIERGWLQQSLRQLVELERRLAHQAHHDGLTGLANRRRFNDRLEELLPSGREPHRGALLMIDLDGFKQVNDGHGHDAGDQLLNIIGRRLGVQVRTGDLVARIGGDEFALVLAGVDDISTAARRAERVIEAIEQPAQIRDYEIKVSASVGIALVDGDSLSPSELLRNADLALYHAKALGKGRFALYDPAMRVEAEARRVLVRELEVAIAHRQFEVFYQPIHDIVSGQLLGAEALIRWQHPERGRLDPAHFIPVAEQTGLIAPIGELMFDIAVTTAAGWVNGLAPDQAFTLNVNLSARQLRDIRLVDTIRLSLARAGLDPSRLVIEITESAIIEDIEHTREIVAQLNRLGVLVALDDFGTGYSSLSHVRSFPLHHLKIDKSFVASVATSATDAAVVGSIVHLASALGVVAVAEGIETPEQLAELRRRGCRVGQGYLMSEPLDWRAFGELLRSHRTSNWLISGPGAAA